MHKNITAGIPVFTRVEVTRRCLDSLNKKGVKKVVVADDGKVNSEKRSLYNEFERKFEDFNLIDMKYNAGLSRKRNAIVNNVDTEYILLMDNDVTVHSIRNAFKILENKDNVGVVSGMTIEHKEGLRLRGLDLKREGKYLIKGVFETPKYNEELDYFLFDQTANCGLFRKKMLDENPWDNFYVIGYEHVDFYLSLMETDWDVAVSPSVVFQHEHIDDENYESKRFGENRLQKSREYFLNKWNLKDVILVRTSYVDTYCEMRNRMMEILYNKFPLYLLSKIQKVI